MLQTSLTRPRITCYLTVSKLVDLQVIGFAQVRLDSLDTERLALTFSGAGDVRIGALAAGLLEVDLRWIGQVEVAGKVTEQRVQLGMGTYGATQAGEQASRGHAQGGWLCHSLGGRHPGSDRSWPRRRGLLRHTHGQAHPLARGPRDSPGHPAGMSRSVGGEMKQRTISLLVVLALFLGLAGCGGDSSPNRAGRRSAHR